MSKYQEIEKKYIVNPNINLSKFLEQFDNKIVKKHIQQFYIGDNNDFSSRIRIVNDKKAEITIKSKNTGLSRFEFNENFPIDVALEMKKINTSRSIIKTRYKIPYNEHTIELDVFKNDFKGIIMAEMEFSSIEEAEKEDLLKFKDIIVEVSNREEFTNAYMAEIENVKEWIKLYNDLIPNNKFKRSIKQ